MQFITSDNHIVPFGKNLVDNCPVIQDLLQMSIADTPIKLDYEKEYIDKIIEYCDYHAVETNTTKWDNEWVEIKNGNYYDNDKYVELAKLSQFLGYKKLTRFIGKKLQAIVKDKNVDEIREAIGMCKTCHLECSHGLKPIQYPLEEEAKIMKTLTYEEWTEKMKQEI